MNKKKTNVLNSFEQLGDVYGKEEKTSFDKGKELVAFTYTSENIIPVKRASLLAKQKRRY